MFSCKHCGGKINVYLPSRGSPQAFPICFAIVRLLPIPPSATFPYPPMLYSISISLSLCPTAFHHPPSLFAFPHYPSLLPFLPLIPHSLPFLCSEPICSHYIDGPDDSVEWCTLSPVPLQGPFSAACSCSSTQR